MLTLYRLYTLYRSAPAPVRAVVDLAYGIVPNALLRSRATRRMERELERSQWLEPAAVELLQRTRLRRLVSHAVRRVPYYRALARDLGVEGILCAESGLEGEAWERFSEAFARIPVLTRSDVQRNADALCADDRDSRSLYQSATSGSSGIYLEFWRDTSYFDVEQAFTQRALGWAGVRPKWRHAIFYRAIMTHPTQDGAGPPYERFRNRLILSQFHTDDAGFTAYARLLADFRPDHLTVFPTTLLMFTRWCAERGLHPIRPRVIVCYSENLYDEHRREMEDYWGCRIFNRYGHAEGCISAAECGEGGLHLDAEYGHVEVLDENGEPLPAGSAGRLVATGFFTDAMPFLRYDTGDIGAISPSPCGCGRGLPVLSQLDGRGDDLIIGVDGRRVAAWRAIFSHTHGIRLVQIVQEHPGEAVLRIVPGEGYDDGIAARILENLRSNAGDALRLRVELVEDVERTPSGKIRLVLSRLRPVHEEGGGGAG